MAEVTYRRAGDDIDLAYPVDLVAEELDADGLVVRVGREYLDRIAAHAEHVALEGDIVSLVAYLYELAQQLVEGARLPRAQGYDHAFVVDRVAEAVDARHRGDDDHVAALEKAGGRAVAQALDLVVYGAVLFDKCIGVRDIRLGLVIVVVGDKILDRVIREKLAELRAQLRGERFIVRQHERRPVQALNDACHREGLARARDAEEHLLVEAAFYPPHERIYRLGLISRRRV